MHQAIEDTIGIDSTFSLTQKQQFNWLAWGDGSTIQKCQSGMGLSTSPP